MSEEPLHWLHVAVAGGWDVTARTTVWHMCESESHATIINSIQKVYPLTEDGKNFEHMYLGVCGLIPPHSVKT